MVMKAARGEHARAAVGSAPGALCRATMRGAELSVRTKFRESLKADRVFRSSCVAEKKNKTEVKK